MNISDGGEEKKRKSEYNENRVRVGTDNFGLARAGRDDYSRALARVAVAQICKGVGFNYSKESALLALSDVAVRFMRDIGKSASSCACLAEVECCPVVSGVVKELVEFVETAEEIPFALRFLLLLSVRTSASIEYPKLHFSDILYVIVSSQHGNCNKVIEPDWRPALTLKKTMEDQIAKDGVIGIGLTVTAVGVLIAGIAASLARK
ncbi:hypothetical protein Droror1_Dr00016975 [Drosera rotundifolia]